VAAHEPFELLYLDPPYNSRQYTGYYHIPELIATGWFNGDVVPRGKTGLVTDPAKRSDWSRRNRCESALERLVASARCRHIVMSYNSEGLIPETAIARIFREHGLRKHLPALPPQLQTLPLGPGRARPALPGGPRQPSTSTA
jgi:adenine-specific DNA-methyltransferase